MHSKSSSEGHSPEITDSGFLRDWHQLKENATRGPRPEQPPLTPRRRSARGSVFTFQFAGVERTQIWMFRLNRDVWDAIIKHEARDGLSQSSHLG